MGLWFDKVQGFMLVFLQLSSYCGQGLRHLLKNMYRGFILLVHGTPLCLPFAFSAFLFTVTCNVLVKEISNDKCLKMKKITMTELKPLFNLQKE